MMHALMGILAGVLTALCVAGVILPLVRTGHWVARIFDFPRLQMIVFAAVGLVICVIGMVWLEATGWPIPLGLVFVACMIWQATFVLPFTPVWRPEVPGAFVGARPASLGAGGGRGATLRVLIANLDYTNSRKAEAQRVMLDAEPDVIALIEVDAGWRAALADTFARYPHAHEAVRPEGRGICLVSNRPLGGAWTEHLVSEDRPSIHCSVALGHAGTPLRMVVVHPTPPGLEDEDGGRHDSRERDAELVRVARLIRDDPTSRWLVMGDLNDVAWSHTTRLFRRLSGMRDPRIGRALLNTFHAQKPLLRYPLDHVFVSPGLAIARLERVRIPGSDHFGMLAEIAAAHGAPVDLRRAAEADGADRAEAVEIEREGS